MTRPLPLSRGTLESVMAIRDRVDPSDLLERGPAAVGDLEGGISGLAVFVIDVTGRVAALQRPGEGDALVLWDPGARAGHLAASARAVLTIGRTRDGVLHLALVLEEGTALDGGRWVDVRRTGHLLGDDDSALAVAAVALVRWHREAGFCARCGTRVEVTSAGWTTTCPACHAIEYPRQDPAVIMAVVDEGDRVLLAHNVAWRPGFWSLLAGFMEAGESPDRAVRREAAEEVGLRIGEVRFSQAQPWPFPRSLMLGHHARLAPGSPAEPRPDGVEIDRARFFGREELAAAMSSGTLEPPGPTAIARRLLEEWYGAPLPPTPGVERGAGLPGHDLRT